MAYFYDRHNRGNGGTYGGTTKSSHEAAFDAVLKKIDAKYLVGQARRFYRFYNEGRMAAGPKSCIRSTLNGSAYYSKLGDLSALIPTIHYDRKYYILLGAWGAMSLSLQSNHLLARSGWNRKPTSY